MLLCCLKTSSEKQLDEEQRAEALQRMLNRDFPSMMAVSFALTKMNLIILAMVLQVLAIYHKTTFYFIGAAFWVAPFVFASETLAIVLVRRRSVRLLKLSNIFRIIANVIAIGLVTVNVQALRYTGPDSEVYRFVWINVTMMVVGVTIKSLNFFYSIVMIIRIDKAYKAMLDDSASENSSKSLMIS